MKLPNLAYPGALLLSGGINSQYLDELGDFAEMAECVAGGLVVAAYKVYIEHVFPRVSTHGTRLDLAQADVAQGKDAQRFEQSAGQIFYLKRDGSFVGAASERRPARAASFFMY